MKFNRRLNIVNVESQTGTAGLRCMGMRNDRDHAHAHRATSWSGVISASSASQQTVVVISCEFSIPPAPSLAPQVRQYSVVPSHLCVARRPPRTIRCSLGLTPRATPPFIPLLVSAPPFSPPGLSSSPEAWLQTAFPSPRNNTRPSGS